MKSIKPKNINRQWHLIDAKNEVYYVPYLDTGDFGVVINTEKIQLSGKKETQKKYWRHSGYPGGLYSKTASQLRKQKPELLVKNAVVGMLPKTTLGKQMAKKLYIFAGNQHPFKDKFQSQQNTKES